MDHVEANGGKPAKLCQKPPEPTVGSPFEPCARGWETRAHKHDSNHRTNNATV
jgi:hypothetical protein